MNIFRKLFRRHRRQPRQEQGINDEEQHGPILEADELGIHFFVDNKLVLNMRMYEQFEQCKEQLRNQLEGCVRLFQEQLCVTLITGLGNKRETKKSIQRRLELERKIAHAQAILREIATAERMKGRYFEDIFE